MASMVCNLYGGAENARLEKAGLENAAPYCRTGKLENGLVINQSINQFICPNPKQTLDSVPLLHCQCSSGSLVT